jgi:thiosulfate dehydrogenase
MNRTSSRRYARTFAATFLVVACVDRQPQRIDTVATGEQSPAPPARAAFRIPQESEIRDSVTLASVRRGRALIQFTRDSLPRNVGAALTCGNCHVQGGTQRDAMPLVGSYARFPQYRARSGRVDVLEDRINDCFERSMNGKALDRSGRDMHDIIAYLAFLSLGMPVGVEMEGQGLPKMDPLPGDTVRGRQVFTSTCAVCHGPDGEGTVAAPPLWGPRSYNIGAGMARVNTAAAFIRKVMPRDRPGTLSPQQAFDVAAYINSRPRPDFARKEYDWPHGGAPPDVAYSTRSAKLSDAGR